MAVNQLVQTRINGKIKKEAAGVLAAMGITDEAYACTESGTWTVLRVAEGALGLNG